MKVTYARLALLNHQIEWWDAEIDRTYKIFLDALTEKQSDQFTYENKVPKTLWIRKKFEDYERALDNWAALTKRRNFRLVK